MGIPKPGIVTSLINIDTYLTQVASHMKSIKFMYLISRLKYKGIVILRLRSVSIMQLLRIQSGGWMRNVYLVVVVSTLIGM
jgi:hypothetical protein